MPSFWVAASQNHTQQTRCMCASAGARGLQHHHALPEHGHAAQQDRNGSGHRRRHVRCADARWTYHNGAPRQAHRHRRPCLHRQARARVSAAAHETRFNEGASSSTDCWYHRCGRLHESDVRIRVFWCWCSSGYDRSGSSPHCVEHCIESTSSNRIPVPSVASSA